MDRSLDVQFLILYLKENHFKQGWAKVPAGIKLDDYKEVLVYNIISASIEIFKFYLLLFLSGEYIVIPENNDNDIDKIVEFLREEADEIEKVRSQKLKLELQSKFQDNLFFTIEEIIKLNIVYFNRDLTTQLDLDYKKGLFRGNKLSERIGDIDEGLMQYIEAFRLVISLTRLEHFLFSASQKLIKDLLVIEKQIHYLSIEEKLKKAISVKASFLLKKLIYRLKGKDLDSSPTLIYAFNQEEDVSVELDKIQLDSNLERWEHLIKVHYGYISNFKQEQRKRRKEIENKENSNYCYEDYHGLIKIFKDDTKNLEQSENLYKHFEDKYRNLRKPKNLVYAKTVTQSYLFNNVFSLKCDILKPSIDNYKDLITEVKNQQNKDGVRNYFPWFKLSQTLISKIDQLSENLVDSATYLSFKEYLQLFTNVVSKFEETYEWSYTKKLIPIQMPFNECQSDYIINADGYKAYKLFFFTAFFLPLDYEELNKSKNFLNLKKVKYETLSSVYDKLQYVVEDVKEASEKMRKQERRSIEILAIFSAVALFSVGSIQIFSVSPVQTDPNVYYKFIMSFGYSLALFVLLIWIITRDNIKKIQYYHWIVILLLFFSSCIAIGYFTGSPIQSIFKLIFSE